MLYETVKCRSQIYKDEASNNNRLIYDVPMCTLNVPRMKEKNSAKFCATGFGRERGAPESVSSELNVCPLP